MEGQPPAPLPSLPPAFPVPATAFCPFVGGVPTLPNLPAGLIVVLQQPDELTPVEVNHPPAAHGTTSYLRSKYTPPPPATRAKFFSVRVPYI